MGFFEILLIAVVTLLVVGPERMPEAVRTVALTVGRIKRQFESAKTEIERQVGADDIRRQLHNESIMENISKIKSELSDIDKSIDNGEEAMPWTEDEYEQALLKESGCQHASSDETTDSGTEPHSSTKSNADND